MKAVMRTVLVVDDEAMVRLVAVTMLEDMGFEVLEAQNGHEALQLLDARPDVVLMFTDYRMPGMIGPELARRAAARFPQLHIVLVSGYVDSATAVDWPLLHKPYRSSDLQRILTGVGLH